MCDMSMGQCVAICGQVTAVGIAAYTCSNTMLVNDLYQ